MYLYSVDVKICATAYVKASSKAEALRKVISTRNTALELIQDKGLDLPISGLQFDDPRLPEISLSPAMTVHGPWNSHIAHLAEDSIPGTDGVDPDDVYDENGNLRPGDS